MTEIQYQIQGEPRPLTLVDSTPSIILSDEYEYPFIIASIPVRGVRGFTGATGAVGPTPTPFSETLSGVHNGVNTDFALTHACVPNSLMVFRNGLMEVASIGYSLVGATVSFTTPPLTTDLITVTYYIQP